MAKLMGVELVNQIIHSQFMLRQHHTEVSMVTNFKEAFFIWL